MDILGELNLKENALKNGKFEQLSDFPAEPKVGTWAFIQKQLYICVEVEEKPVWIPLTPKRDTVVYRPPIATDRWEIPHSLKSETVMVQCFDAQDKVVVPDSIEPIDDSTVLVTFPEAITGTAIVMYGYTEGSDVDGKFKAASGMPVGSIFNFAAESKLPEDFLPLMGQTVTKEFFPELVALLGEEGADSVVLKDGRGVFVRNLDYGKGIDVDRVEGSIQEGQGHKHSHGGSVGNTDLGRKYTNTTGKHYHTYAADKGWNGVSKVGMSDNQATGDRNINSSTTGDHRHYTDMGAHGHVLNIDDAGADDGRPKNIAFLLVIKAR